MDNENTQREEPTPLREMPTLRRSTDLTDVDRLLATGERLLRQQEDALLKLLSTYEQAQQVIGDQYRTRVAAAVRERDEQLRILAEQHETRVVTINRVIEKLTAMRDA